MAAGFVSVLVSDKRPFSHSAERKIFIPDASLPHIFSVRRQANSRIFRAEGCKSNGSSMYASLQREVSTSPTENAERILTTSRTAGDHDCTANKSPLAENKAGQNVISQKIRPNGEIADKQDSNLRLRSTRIDPSAEQLDKTSPAKLYNDCKVSESHAQKPFVDSPKQAVDLQYIWPRALLVLVASLWGTSMACVKLVEGAVSPSEGALVRFALAAAALVPSFFRGPRKADRCERDDALPRGLGYHGFLCGVWIFIGYMTQSIALQTTDAGKSAFICSLAVIFVPFITSLFPTLASQHKSSRPSWIAAILAVAGVGFMELGGHSSKFQVGDVWALGQTIGFGMGFIENERALERFPRHAMQLSALQLTVVAVMSFLWSFLSASMHAGCISFPNLSAVLLGHLSPSVLLSILYTGFITTALTIFLENIALVHVSASEMAVILSTEPLFASAWAAFLLHETMGSEAIVGGALIMCACLVNQVGSSKLKQTILPALTSILMFCGGSSKDVV